MRSLILFSLLLPSIALASLNEIQVKNLSGDYSAPSGRGEFEKLFIDLSFLETKYPFELSRTETGFLVSTPMAQVHWSAPPKFIHEAQGLMVRGLDLKLGRGIHTAKAPYLAFTATDAGAVGMDRLELRCKGESVNPDFLYSVLEDCLREMIFSSEKVKVPEDFFFLDVFRRFYGTKNLPIGDLEDLTLTSRDGDFYLYFLTRYYVKAGLRAWGKVSFDEKTETLTLKVNLVKFGIIPITNLVMDELKKTFEGSGSVSVEPPFVHIKLKDS